ncbi:GAF domain-containing protein [Pseudonocardia sp.]|uniref:GAF domain-containing protein n=1 Tax=Pseudonocardia sp. TaxID=60912 RepID=UPI003D106AA9
MTSDQADQARRVRAPDPRADLAAHADLLRRVYDAAMSEDAAGLRPRSLVSDSWQRSLAARVDPERLRPQVRVPESDLLGVREAHPLNEVLPLLRSTLVSIADEAMHIMIVTDADGVILWREGASSLLGPADAVGLVAGSTWAEEAAGTNAMGTTIAVDAPVQIHSAEHLVRTLHAWTCAAAPVHDPDTGTILGAIDITGPMHTVHPAMTQLVAATAQLAENQLRVRMAIADERLRVRNMPHLASLRGRPGALVTPTGRIIAGEPYGTWPERVTLPADGDRVCLDDGREMVVERLAEGFLLHAPRKAPRAAPRRALALQVMGAHHPRVVLDGKPVPVTLRPAELLVALALHPEGLTAEQLALLLYGEEGNPTTVRGEVHRLRLLLGADVLRTRPYRLDGTVDTDFGTVRRLLRAGQPAEALRAASGRLLPRSDAPEIRELRDELEAGLRRGVLHGGDADLLAELACHPVGREDLEVLERAVAALPPDDPRRPEIAARCARLLADG